MKGKAANRRAAALDRPKPARRSIGKGYRWVLVCALILLLPLPTMALSDSLTSISKPVIRIGAIFSTSGFAAEHNRPMLEMVRLAVRAVNDRGGILGHRLELVELNNGSTPIGSLLAATRAVRLGVTAVIGAHWSSHSLIIAPLLQEAGIPMISPGSTNPDVTRNRDYVFRICFLDSDQGMAMASFARQSLQAKTAVILTNIDEEYSITLASYFHKGFVGNGGRIAAEFSYREKTTDYAKILHRIKEIEPDVIYLPGYTSDSGLIILQARKLGIGTTFLGGDAWDNIETISGDAANGSFQSTPWHPDLDFAGSRELRKNLQRYGAWPPENTSTPLAWDSVMVLADAIERAESLTPQAIRDALAATDDYAGATGTLRFDDNGDPAHKPIVIVQLDGNRRKLYQITTP